MRIVTNQVETATVERRTWGPEGTPLEWVVAPVVALVAGVVNGELVTAAEIEQSWFAWNGRPITLGHPMRDGRYVSANTLNVLEGDVVGWFFNAAFDADRLTGEIWLSVALAEKLGGDALAAMTALEGGTPTEVSTAYFCGVEQRAGTFNGEAFDGVQHNLLSDHLALLLHEKGACNWMDGCGAPRVNQDLVNDGVMVAFFPAAADATALAMGAGDTPEGSIVTTPEEMHLTLAYLGTIDEARMKEGELLEYVAGFARGAPIMRGDVNGLARFANDAPTGLPNDLQALVALFDGPYLPEWRQELMWWVEMNGQARRNHGFIPHLTLAYVPAVEATPMKPPAKRPLVFDRVSVVWGNRRTDFALQGMVAGPDDAMAMLANARAARPGKGCNCQKETTMSMQAEKDKDPGTPTTPQMQTEQQPAAKPAEQPTGSPLGPVTNQVAPLPPDVAAVAQLIADLGGVAAVKESLELLKANRDESRQALIQELTANQWCAFSQAELEQMPNPQLTKLAQSLRVPSFAGRGGPRGQQADDEWEAYSAPQAA